MSAVKTTGQISALYGIPVADNLADYPFVRDKTPLLPYPIARRTKVLPLELQGDLLFVAVANPLDLEGLEEVRCHTGYRLQELYAPLEAIEKAIETCFDQKEETTAHLLANLAKKSPGAEVKEETDGYDLLAQEADSPVVKLLNALLLEAIQQGASDVHVEPAEEGVKVRYRIDGVLQLRHSPPKEYQSQIITRLKVMASLDIAEQRLPQDGRIKLGVGGRQIDFRMSTIPVAHGERIVLRILDKSNVLVGLATLGMRSDILTALRALVRLSEGIVLVTGPTGSGKTTTLYSALSDINSPEINIMTIEDPVEYKLQGMAQMGVNPKIKLDFATGLRHILRQDPDVIMIGEIRDRETAEIAIQAALTGHLVLSTLHTNDAPAAITRLVDMGIEPYLLSSSVVGVLAQRLVRKLCPHCKEGYTPAPAELTQLGLEPMDGREQTFYHARGCDACFHAGYRGRHGIYELMPLTHRLKRQLLKSADSLELQKVALEEGLSSLRKEGGLLVQNGITSTAEILRVSRGDDGF
jgi:general secretion pathway protein E